MSRRKKDPEQDPIEDAVDEPQDSEQDEENVGLDAEGAIALLQAEEHPEATVLPTIELPTAHHYGITRIAVEQRAEALKKLADKTAGEGYLRESRVILADSQALKEDVLPQFKAQGELPLATYESVKYGIQNTLRGPVWKHVLQKSEDQTDHRNQLLDVIGSKMAQLVHDVAERAYNAGLQARTATPEEFAIKTLREMGG